MGESLKESYTTLDDKVRERMRKLQERLDELERLRKATINREFMMKELRDRVKELEEELRRVKG